MDMPDFGINLGINPGEWFGDERPEEIRNKEYERQKEFAQNSLQWRVADAKAAGLHPLFGLSGGSSSYSPVAVVGQGSSVSVGPGRGDSESAPARRGGEQDAVMTPYEKERLALDERAQQDSHARTLSGIASDTATQNRLDQESRLLQLQQDQVRQQLLDSARARGEQLGTVNKERAVVRPGPTVGHADVYAIEPHKITSSDGPLNVGPIAAGKDATSPAWERVMLAPGLPALVPSGSAQNLGDMEMSGWIMTAAATLLWYGDGAMEGVINQAKKFGKALNRATVHAVAAGKGNLPQQRVHPH